MNAEILKMRKAKNMSAEIYGDPKRIDENKLNKIIFNFNRNFAELFEEINHNNVDINTFIDKFAQNMYIILEIIRDMNFYPDYFFDVVFKRNIDLSRISVETPYANSLLRERAYSETIGDKIIAGLENGYYHLSLYHTQKNNELEEGNYRDINDYFTEMVSYYQVFNRSYNNNSIEQCRISFSKHYNEIINIVDSFYVSDYLYGDVECLIYLLFQCFSFFVEIGVNPKEYIDNYINQDLELGKSK